MRAARRTNAKTTLAALCLAMIAVILITDIADARGGLDYRGLRRALARERTACTAAQVSDKDPKLAACYSAQDDDVRNNRPYTHYVFCTNGVRSCCQVDNPTGATSNCARIDRTVKSRDAANPVRPGATRP